MVFRGGGVDTDTLYGGGENPLGSRTLDNRGLLQIGVQAVAAAGEPRGKPIVCAALTGIGPPTYTHHGL